LYLLGSLWLYIQLVPVICPSELYEASICFAPWFVPIEETLICLFLIIGLMINYHFIAKYLTKVQLKNLTRLSLLICLLWVCYLMIFDNFHFIYQAISVLTVLIFKELVFKDYSVEPNIEKQNEESN
jgi:hypothetical protein